MIFHLWLSLVVSEEKNFGRLAPSPDGLLSGLYNSSEMAGMLLRLIVPSRDIIVTANVALSKGSSQHGKTRRAAVGFLENSVTITISFESLTYLKMSQSIEFLLPLIVP